MLVNDEALVTMTSPLDPGSVDIYRDGAAWRWRYQSADAAKISCGSTTDEGVRLHSAIAFVSESQACQAALTAYPQARVTCPDEGHEGTTRRPRLPVHHGGMVAVTVALSLLVVGYLWTRRLRD